VYTLTRTVRFAVSPAPDAPPDAPGEAADAPSTNGYAGVPVMRGLGAHYELDLACRGEPHPVTGYLLSITDLDRIARNRLIPAIEDAVRSDPAQEPAGLLPELANETQDALAELGASLDSIRWRLSPFYSLQMNTQDDDNKAAVTLRQRFEFAASHRLHAPELTDEENQRVYGKCNNPSGHGHNYVVEPAVVVPLISGQPALSLAQLEPIVKRAVIDRFDHKHLGQDLDDFTGVVPSVENIAKRCYELLEPEIAAGGARLSQLTVWETEKTSCTYAP